MMGYVAALVLGALLVGAAAVKGDAHADGGVEFDHGAGDGVGLLKSLRFWSFALAFGGLTGVVLAALGSTNEGVTALLALLVGASAGGTASRVIAALSRHEVGAVGDVTRHIGREGRLLLPLSPGAPAKVRVRGPEGDVDLVAVWSDGHDGYAAAGATVLVVDTEGARVRVAPAALEKEA
jgi:hypothetical protein